MKFSVSVLVFLFFRFYPGFSQEPVSLPDKSGIWTYAYLEDENTKMYIKQFGMTVEEAVLFRKKLDRIVNALHQYPVMLSPKGVDPLVESRPIYPHGFNNHPENYSFTGEIRFRLCPWFDSKGKIYKQTIEPPSHTVLINQVQKLKTSAFNVAGPEDAEVEKAEIRVNEICIPRKNKELGPGVTLYDAALVVCQPGRSLYLPCSAAEAFKRIIAFYELAAKKEPVYQVILDGIRKEFSAIPSDKLKGPAYFGGEFSGITTVPNKDPLYLFNNEFFDRRRARTDVQLIVFPIDADYFRKETDFIRNDVGFLRIYQFLHSLQAGELVKLVD